MKGCAFLILSQSMVLTLFLTGTTADKLSSNQKAPIYASSAGGLSLPLPLANAQKSSSTKESADGVVHEETETYKTEGNEFIRVVTGKVGYTSPEGLPVSIKYMADENGNRASFTIGNPSSGSKASSGGSGSVPSRPSGGSPSKSGSSGGNRNGNSNKGGAKGGKSDSYLPPDQMKKDRTYLPPTKS